MRGRVLIVDDDGDIVNSLQGRLEWLGYDCQSASNGKEAIRIIRENDPDIVLLDLEMPELGGDRCHETIGGRHDDGFFLSPRSSDHDGVRDRQ